MEQEVQSKADAATSPSTVQSNHPSSAAGIGSASEPVDVDEQNIGDDEPVARKGRRRTSAVWRHFEEPVEKNGSWVAQCRGCKRDFAAGNKSGTSHLTDHYKLRCPKRHLKLQMGQQQLQFGKKDDNADEAHVTIEPKFKQEISRAKLVNMIIVHEYPLSMVDHVMFRDFVSSLNSKFRMISRNTLRSDILKMFESEKVAMKKFLQDHDSRIALTTDMWTSSNQKKGYMAVTSHFVDKDWILRNRTLRFSYVPTPHTKDVLASIIMDSVYKYGLESRISSIVLDNCTTNDAIMDTLRGKFEASSLMLGGEFLHMRCCAHILNLIVRDGLDSIHGEIATIRENIGFWLATPKRLEKFEDTARSCKVSSTKRLVLDCKTRWNSTYQMLETAIPYKDVFSKLKRLNNQVRIVLPTEKQWELASKICNKLELFYKISELFSGKNYPTSNLYFTEICEIKIQLRTWLKSDVPEVVTMASNMIIKFDKYWSKINGLLAVATVLDPRSKLDCVEFFFRMIYEDEAEIETEKVKSLLLDLILEYKQKANENVESENTDSSHGGVSIPSYGRGRQLFSLHKKQKKKRRVSVNAELDRYLEDDELPDDNHFDILGFWKNNCQYPTLREIAKDVLAIPVSSVASESAFSTGGRVLSPHRSRLHSKTVEALMCLQNWIIGSTDSPIKSSFAYASVLEDEDSDSCVSGVTDEYDGDDVYMTCNF